jgi:uncharacterized ferritin-like protein (DUF455 family)
MELRQLALQALCLADPAQKVHSVQDLWSQREGLTLETAPALDPQRWVGSAALPGRPALPRLIAAKQVPQRSPFTRAGRAALLHAVCHIEFNAINLALDAIWRFADMPCDYYRDWLQVAYEESCHFDMLRQHLETLSHQYGDFAAHDGLWTMCTRTAHDVVARMALVPRTLEARGLDATPLIQHRLRQCAEPDALQAVALLDIILRDEIGHVAIGNRWYHWLCEQRGLDPVTHDRWLVQQHEAPRLKPPFNIEARKRAGFTTAELDALVAQAAEKPAVQPRG